MDVDGLNPLFARAEVITELLNYGNPSEFAEEVVDLLREEVASLITRFDQAYWLAEDAEDPLVGELDQAIEALGSAVGHFFGPASGSSVVTDDETERVRVLSVQHADSAGTPGLVNPATVASRSTNNAIVGVELALDIHHIELTSRITVVPVPGTDAYEEAIFNEGIQDIMADAIKQVDEELRRESQDVLDRKLAEACLFFDHIEDPLHHAMLQLKSAGSDSRPFFVFVVPERSFYCVDALRAKARTLGAQLGIAHCTLELELCFAVREQLVPVNGNWETTMWVNKVYEDEKGKLLCLTTDHPVGPRTLELKIEDLVGPFPRNAEQPTAVMMEDPEDFTRRGNGGLVKDSEGLAQVTASELCPSASADFNVRRSASRTRSTGCCMVSALVAILGRKG